MTNHEISEKLLEHARSLHGGATLYRARAVRHAAMLIAALDYPIAELIRGGREELCRMPGISEHLAFTIEALVHTGKVMPWQPRQRW
jgi:DNA polymerase/3'-5' exonuclease PolX